MDEPKDNAAPTQDAAQPEAPGTPPAKSEVEIKLEGQLKEAEKQRDTYKKERDKAKNERDKAAQEREELRTENTGLKLQLAEANKPKEAQADDQTAAAATQEPTEEDNIKDILKRNGLKKCWMLESGPCFSEVHAKEYAGAGFDSLTVISVEEDAAAS